MRQSPVLQRIAYNVRYLREKADLTQEALAEQTGLTQTYISLLESGKRGISWVNLGKIATVLMVDEVELILHQTYGNFLKIKMLTENQKEKLRQLIEIYLHADRADNFIVQAIENSIEAAYRLINPPKNQK